MDFQSARKYLKLIFVLFCISGLVYHTFGLYFEYMSGKTIVNIKVDQILNETIPAITFCFDAYVSLEKVLELNPLLYNLTVNYKNERARLINNSIIDPLGPDRSNKYFSKLKYEISLMHNWMNVSEFFEKITIPQEKQL